MKINNVEVDEYYNLVLKMDEFPVDMKYFQEAAIASAPNNLVRVDECVNWLFNISHGHFVFYASDLYNNHAVETENELRNLVRVCDCDEEIVSVIWSWVQLCKGELNG